MPLAERLPLAGLTVHQWLPTFSVGDAMGAAAVAFRRALRTLGALGEIYAAETSLPTLVKPMSAFVDAPGALVLYHHGIASPLAGALMHLEGPTGVVFHNITPARLYAGTRLEEPLRAGRAQLAALATSVDVSLAVSPFNARELSAAGHENVQLAPLFIEPERFDAGQADSRLLKALSGGPRPAVVSVSRVVPHKRVDDLLSLHAELLRLAPDATLRIIGGFAPGHREVKALLERAESLGGVELVGRVTHGELVASYRAADVYVSMSEHEGFGVPLIEAMASDLPVLAFGAAAVPETMGGRGIVFDTKHFAALAELVLLLQRDVALRSRLIDGQRQRVAELSLEHTAQALGQALAPFAPAKPRGKPSPRPRVAIVVQRFGEAITGGAEAHARQVALQLAKDATVDVLTTCATDHLTWANELPESESLDGQVRVHRYRVERPRQMRPFNRLSDTMFGHGQDLVAEERWVAEQGPVAPGLMHAVQRCADTHDALIFFTALYAPTALGLPTVANKALLVPTAHDEPPMQFHLYGDAFERAQVLLCNTPEEASFIRARFPRAARSRIVGVGVEPPPSGELEVAQVRERFGLVGPYLIYVGRLEAGKGVPALIKAHQALVKQFHDAPMLVLAGTGELSPTGERVKLLGRVTEADKWSLLAGALAAVVPSRYESLSLLALEAMAVGTPVLGNQASAVVEGQLNRSRAGVTYTEAHPRSFSDAVQKVGQERTTFSKNARRFAAQYRWSAVVEAYLDEIEWLQRPVALS